MNTRLLTLAAIALVALSMNISAPAMAEDADEGVSAEAVAEPSGEGDETPADDGGGDGGGDGGDAGGGDEGGGD